MRDEGAKHENSLEMFRSKIAGLGRSPGGGNGNPLQYSCLENPMDRGAWQATVHGVAKQSDMTQQLNNNNDKLYPKRPTLTVNTFNFEVVGPRYCLKE